jgi:Leucine-rich repeat (LRR) protein
MRYIHESAQSWNPPDDYTHLDLRNIEQEEFDSIIPLISPNVVDLEFNNCDIQHLLVPDGIKWLFAEDLGLRSVTLPESADIVYLANNRLTTINIPRSIMYLDVSKNRLKSVTSCGTFNRFAYLDVESNRNLKTLDFATSCKLMLKQDDDLLIGNLLKDWVLSEDELYKDSDGFPKFCVEDFEF